MIIRGFPNFKYYRKVNDRMTYAIFIAHLKIIEAYKIIIRSSLTLENLLQMAHQKIGCIGKCTSGLSLDDISRITQNIDQTLRDPVGRKILRKYLIRGGRRDDPKCLEFYERCSGIVSKEESSVSSTNRASEDFVNEFDTAMYEAADLNEISEITLALLERFGEARDSQQRDVMIDVLKDAMTSASDHLRKSHPAFSRYVQQPCPRNK